MSFAGRPRLLPCVLVGAIWALASFASAVAEPATDPGAAELSELVGRIALSEREVADLRSREVELSALLASRRQSRLALEKSVAGFKGRVRALEAERAKIDADLADQTANARRRQKDLSDRLAFLYKRRADPWVDLILSSRGPADLERRLKVARLAIFREAGLVAEIRERVETARKARALLDAKLAEISAAARDREKAESAVSDEQREIDRLLMRLHDHERIVLQRMDRTRVEKVALEAEVERVKRDSKKDPPPVATPPPVPRKSITPPPVAPPAAPRTAVAPTPVAGVSGAVSMAWPLSREHTLLALFGERKDPETGAVLDSAGLDIAGADGEPVFAAAAGKVRYKGEMRSLGHVVILDHGSGIATLYSNLGAAAVDLGQTVAAGQIVGTVGRAQRASTPPYLHFEVRVEGQARDPMDWL